MAVTAPITPIPGLAALRQRVGGELGRSGWVTVAQDRIDAFAESTGDLQWIHVDVERAKAESPFGGTVAHGFLTLSMLPMLAAMAFRVEGVAGKINYGLNRVRFPAPVPAGAAVRGSFRLDEIRDLGEGRHMITVGATVELENAPRPACTAEMLAVYIE